MSAQEPLDLSLALVFGELTYRIPLKCISELLATDCSLWLSRIYTVKSQGSVPAFDEFWSWLFLGRERPIPREHVAEVTVLALGRITSNSMTRLNGIV
jgi:hypothetical protein